MTWDGTERRDRAYIEEIARQVAHDTVEETFLTLGVDTSRPESVLEMQENMAFLHKIRTGAEKIGGKIILTIVIVVTVGVIGLVGTNIMKG
jgi:hypothetical protein